MHEHRATVLWERGEHGFAYEEYSRDHRWTFEGGVEVPGSAAPDFLGSAERVDPEEAYVASLSSCHMLTFLALASRRRKVVDAYRDAAVGHMEKNEDGRLAVTRVVLRPAIRFADGTDVSPEEIEKLHHRAHEQCFIANSVRTEIVVEQQPWEET